MGSPLPEIVQCLILLDIEIPVALPSAISAAFNDALAARGYRTRAIPGTLCLETGRALHREIHETLTGAACPVCRDYPLT